MTYKQMYRISAQREFKVKNRLITIVCLILSLLMLIGMAMTMVGLAGVDGNFELAVVMMAVGLIVALGSGFACIRLAESDEERNNDDYDYLDED